jgi:hypothetical protein
MTPPTAIPGKEADFGTVFEIKTFYEGKNSEHSYGEYKLG